MMHLTIDTQPPIELSEPDIISISGYRRALGGESPTLTATIDNALGQHTAQFANPPLRHRAQITHGGLAAIGLIQTVRLGATISLTIET